MKSFKYILAVGLIISAAYFLTNSQREESRDDAPTTSNEAHQDRADSSAGVVQKSKQNQKEENKKDDEKKPTAQSGSQSPNDLTLSDLEEFDQISQKHKKSLITQAKILKNFARRQTRSDILIEKLRELETRPHVMNDENPHTGSMKVVRTRSPFPGTRYFHAQYFDNEQGEEYVQHMSFEFKPGEQSFEAVKKSIKLAYDLGTPLEDKKNFISWRQGKDYVVWVKKMGLEDMKDDPFNAYSENDVGTVRVAKELEIHDQAPAFHIQQGTKDAQEP